MIDPALEKPLLNLHRAMNVNSFWKAVQQVLSAAIRNRVIGLTLQHNPILPLIARWTQPMPQGFFAAEPLQSYVATRPRQKFVRIGDLFPNRRSFIKSAFYRRYMAPQKCLHGVGLFFWKRQRLVCMIAIMRTAPQGAVSPAEMKLLRQLYPQFLVAFADDYFALGSKVDLSKQSGARLLRRVGKRAGGGANDKGPVADSV